MISKYGTIGILGGMGPEATANTYHEIIDSTPVTKDQEHIPVIIYSNPQIPDRTEGILYNGESPLPELIITAKKLEYSGANFIIIPCNTSHFFIKELRASVNIPVISMIEETLNFVKKNYPDITKIGLLATTGTIHTGIYKNTFSSANIDIIVLEHEEQESLVTESIYGNKGIKSGEKLYSNKLLKDAVLNLQDKGAELTIMGCTEIPLALKQEDVGCILLNPTKILCEKSVSLAKEYYNKETELFIEEEEE